MTDNELIAEFMGFEKTDCFYEATGVPRQCKYKSDIFGMTYPGQWAFHVKWDWLMPVVEKIEQMTDLVYSFEIHIGASCRIYADGKDIETTEDGIDGVYKAVVEFIKWYNQNK